MQSTLTITTFVQCTAWELITWACMEKMKDLRAPYKSLHGKNEGPSWTFNLPEEIQTLKQYLTSVLMSINNQTLIFYIYQLTTATSLNFLLNFSTASTSVWPAYNQQWFFDTHQLTTTTSLNLQNEQRHDNQTPIWDKM